MAMEVSASELLRTRLPCDSSAPSRGRRALGGIAEIEPVHDDALLVASELITEAVIRSPGGAQDELQLVAERVPDGVRIAVADRLGDNPASSPGLLGDAVAAMGIGRLVVKAVARRWGTERVDGQRVWAVVGA